MKFKSIAVVLALFSTYVIFSAVYLSTIVKSTEGQTYTYLSEITKLSAKTIKTKVDGDIELVKSISAYIGSQENFDIELMLPILQKETKLNSFKRMGIILPNGMTSTTDGRINDLSGREYFKLAMQGKSVVSDTLIDITDGEPINVYATPIFHKNEIAGVLIAVHDMALYQELLSISTFGGEGYSHIVKSDGTVVVRSSHRNSAMGFSNLFELLDTDIDMDNILIDEIAGNMQSEKEGHAKFYIGGVGKHMNYEAIGVNDWYVTSIVPDSAASEKANLTVSAALTSSISAIVIFMLLLGYILNEQKKSKQALEDIAFVDGLTKSPSWIKFQLDCKKLLQSSGEKQYAMIVFDVDKFKLINDVFGEKRGNETLIFIANELRNHIRSNEAFGRISADNFSMLLTYHTDTELIERMQSINQNIVKYYESYRLHLSFGVYKVLDKTLDISTFSDRASLAKRTVKNKIDDSYAFYSDQIRDKLLIEKNIENEMEAALENQEFKMYLQPKYSLSEDKIVGAEALVRWVQGDKKIHYPDTFIPLFEKNGFIKKLDYFMFEQACILLQRFQLQGREPIPISVNLSRVHLSSSKVLEDLSFIARTYGVPYDCLEIELTESAFFDNNTRLLEVMNGLKNKGFKISIDDFGSGYSSLNMLKDLPVDVLKIDKVFLEQASDTVRGQKIIANILNMANDLSLSTVAEGVETKEQASYLKANGCHIAQGYYYARPMRIEEFDALLKTFEH